MILDKQHMSEHDFINYLRGFLDAKRDGLDRYDVNDLIDILKNVISNTNLQYPSYQTTYQPPYISRTIDIGKELNITGPICGDSRDLKG